MPSSSSQGTKRKSSRDLLLSRLGAAWNQDPYSGAPQHASMGNSASKAMRDSIGIDSPCPSQLGLTESESAVWHGLLSGYRVVLRRKVSRAGFELATP